MTDAELFAKPYRVRVERGGCFKSVLIASFLLGSIVLPCVNATGSRDPGTGRIRVLFIGERSGVTPYNMLESDPLMDPSPVMASVTHYSLDIAKRSIRLYMPRRYGDLTSYQVIIICDANADIFSGKHMAWIREVVRSNGSGLVMIGGFEAFGGMAGNANWGETVIGEVLPVECVPGMYFWGRIVVREPGHPFVASLPLEPNPPWMRLYDGNMLELREGAVELASQVSGDRNPFWSTFLPSGAGHVRRWRLRWSKSRRKCRARSRSLSSTLIKTRRSPASMASGQCRRYCCSRMVRSHWKENRRC